MAWCWIGFSTVDVSNWMIGLTMKKLLLALAVLCLPSAAHADITIGVYGPLTGPVASESDYWKVGAEQAVDDINAQGGVLGQKLKLEMMDDACDPRQAVAVMNRMVAKDVKVILNASCSGSTMAASPIADEAGIPQIVTIALNSAVTDHGWRTVFRLSGRDNDHARVAADFLLKQAKGKKIAVIHDKSTFCRGLADLVKARLAEGGVSDIVFLDVNPGENDFSPLIARLKNEGVGAVYLGLFMREGGLFVRQARDQKLQALMVGASTLSLPEFKHITGDAGEGFYTVRAAEPPKVTPEVVERLKARGRMEPNVLTYGSYAAIETLAQAMTRAGAADSAKVVQELGHGRCTTLMGPLSFNAKGDSDLPVALLQWRGREVVAVP